VPLDSPGGRRRHLDDDGVLDAPLRVGVDGYTEGVDPDAALPVAVAVAEEVVKPPHAVPPVVAGAGAGARARGAAVAVRRDRRRQERPPAEHLWRGVQRLVARRVPVVVWLGPVVRLRRGGRWRARPRGLWRWRRGGCGRLRERRSRHRLRGGGGGRRGAGGDGVAGGGGGRERRAVGGGDVVAAGVWVRVVVVELVVV